MDVCLDVVRYWFVFFKQKTAYEMRISDWSSDVCSSDLALRHISGLAGWRARHWRMPTPRGRQRCSRRWRGSCALGSAAARSARRRCGRSEEHTSELKSLMRISYAVFCLKKKKHRIQSSTHISRELYKETW